MESRDLRLEEFYNRVQIVALQFKIQEVTKLSNGVEVDISSVSQLSTSFFFKQLYTHELIPQLEFELIVKDGVVRIPYKFTQEYFFVVCNDYMIPTMKEGEVQSILLEFSDCLASNTKHELRNYVNQLKYSDGAYDFYAKIVYKKKEEPVLQSWWDKMNYMVYNLPLQWFGEFDEIPFGIQIVQTRPSRVTVWQSTHL